jgi:hypothetical protein
MQSLVPPPPARKDTLFDDEEKSKVEKKLCNCLNDRLYVNETYV